MERNIYSELLQWKHSLHRKPLILNGARQVGKTWLLKEFGRREYENVAYISLDTTRALHKTLSEGLDAKNILRAISALTAVDIKPEKTLVIIDEIQEEPLAISALKYLCEDAPEYHVAVAGSMLGVALHKGVSYPVGKVCTMRLYPLDFNEFLLAMGEKQIVEIMRSGDFLTIDNLSDKLTNLLRQYYFVGGMPEAVLGYAEKGELNSVRQIQNEILSAYQADISKHSPSETETRRITMVWRSILSQLSKENKKFIYGALKKGGRAKEFEVAIEWLVDAGLVYKIPSCTKPAMPLPFYEDLSSFKLYLCDCGLMGAMAGTTAASVLVSGDIFTEYKGAFAEQFVLQQILAAGHSPVMYHSAVDSRLEMDFLLQNETNIVPVEVKAGRSVRTNSLHAFLQQNHDIHAIRFSMRPYEEQPKITNVPLYSACGYLLNKTFV